MQRTRKTNGNQYWIYGKHPVLAALANKNRSLEQLLVTKNALSILQHSFSSPQLSSINIVNSTKEEILHACGQNDAVTQGFALQTKPLLQPSFADLLQLLSMNAISKSTMVLLDHITDPHNIGSIIRSAAAFGASAVVTTKDNSPGETASIVKAAAGAFEQIPFIHVVNLTNTISILKKHMYWAVGFDCNAQCNISNTRIDFANIALIFGSEEGGLRHLVKSSCDLLLKIEINPKVESLNVANAVTVALFAHNHSRSTTI